MYHTGCGTINCGGRLAAATSPRFDVDYWLRRAQDELRDEPRPALYFWVAYDLAEWLDEWLTSVNLGAPWIPGPHGGDVNANYVNAVIDIDAALDEIGTNLKKAQGLDLGPSLEVNPGNRMRQALQTTYDHVAHVNTVLSAILVAIENTRAGAMETVYRRAKEAGADISKTSDFLADRFHALMRNAKDVTENEIINPVLDAAEKAGTDLGNKIRQLEWADILKVIVPVAVVGALGFYALKKV